MPKKLCVRTLMNSEYVKVSKKFHKSAPRYFCHIFRSLCTEICSKNFVSVVPEILRLFVNTFTPNDTYSVSVKANVWHNQFKWYYLIIKKYFFHFFFFFCISGIYIKFEILWEKRWASEIICLWNYRLQKAELLKCQKSPVSERLWTVNMLKALKHSINRRGSIFVWFFDQCERKSARTHPF